MLQAILATLGFIVVDYIIFYSKKHEKVTQNMVRCPKWYFFFGVIGFVFFMIPTIITLFLELSLFFPICFACFSLLGVVLVVLSINTKIFYDEEKIIFQNFFGRKKTFLTSEISGYRPVSLGYYVYFKTSRRSVERTAVGQEQFLAFCRRKYAEVHNAPLPYK